MKSKYILLVILVLSFNLKAQDTITHHWVSKGSIIVDSSDYWTLDGFSNNLMISDNSIQKVDSNGVIKFSQSIKSLGNTSAIIPINALKIIHFSAEQQTLCFFDNTLTASEDCIDLVELEISNASLVCASSRSDKLWIYDDLNSSLGLFSMNGLSDNQEIVNISGLFELDSISQLMEQDGRLYMLDKKKGLYVFDLLGSLLEVISKDNIQAFDVSDESIFFIRNSELNVIPHGSEEILTYELPLVGVNDLIVRQGVFYFRTNKIVHKYRLQF